MITIDNIEVSAGEVEIIKWVSLQFEPGKNYCLLWKNGSGKSTLSSVLMWHPKYEVTAGEITIDWEDLVEMEPNERSQAGIFLSFQNIPEIKWVKLSLTPHQFYKEKKLYQIWPVRLMTLWKPFTKKRLHNVFIQINRSSSIIWNQRLLLFQL